MATTSIVSSGQVLLAEPFLVDPYFHRAVVLLCEHREEGSLGFILNKKMNMSLGNLIPDFEGFEAEVLYGGPVHVDTLSYLHNVGDLLDDSLKVADGIWLGGDFEQLGFLIKSGLIEEKHIRFYMGCSGWSGGQLEEEMEIQSWIPASVHPNYVFKSASDALWQQVMYNKGGAFEIISKIPDFMTWN